MKHKIKSAEEIIKKEQDEWESIKRRYPTHDVEGYFEPPQAMFPIDLLSKAWQYYRYRVGGNFGAEHFLNYLWRLEQDIPLDQQKVQPNTP